MAHKLLCVPLLLFGLIGPAMAYDYVASLAFGQARISDLNRTDALISAASSDETASASGVQFAALIREDVAVKLTYNNLGSFSVSSTSDGVSNEEAVEVTSLALLTSPSLRLAEDLRVYANLGLHAWDASLRDRSSSGADFVFGGGLSYRLTERFMAGFEAKQYDMTAGYITQFALSLGFRL